MSTPPSFWFSALSSTTDRSDTGYRPRAIVSGRGCFVRDVAGNEYLDARSALWNAALGYGNQRIVDAMTRQLAELPVAQVIRHDQPTRIALDYADRLVATLPGELAHVRFCTTGAQAVEGAVLLSRFVRRQTGEPDRTHVIAQWNGYHGIGGLASGLTGESPLHEQQTPLAPGVHHIPAGDFDALRAMIDRVGRDRVTAVVLEPVLGTDVVELSAEFLHRSQRLCRTMGIHLILDEVSTGFGRTGSLTVAGRLGLAPDMLVLSKGITSGYAPLSAIAVTADVLQAAISVPGNVFPHGSTSDGHPVALAAATAVLDELADGHVLGNVTARGTQLTTAIRALSDRLPAVRAVHGPGLMVAVELADQTGAQPTADTMFAVKQSCRDAGLLVSISNHMVLLTPPLVITAPEIELLVTLLEQGVRTAINATTLDLTTVGTSG